MKETILITGGNGFLGRHLATRLKEKYRVILGSRNNKNNFQAETETGCEAIPLDITDIEAVRYTLHLYHPAIIIHAAATKFVDRSEKYPMETIDVNILGSQNIAQVAMEVGTPLVVGISTDKACPPIRNMYGLSKAAMERLFCLLDGQSSTKFIVVRYGNVAWSTGSVLPVWKRMSETDNQVITTGSEMRRFFFTVDEAVDLVLSAIDISDDYHGFILSKEMKAAKIEDVLNVWKRVYNVDWIIGTERPGERQDEFLIGETETSYCHTIMINNQQHFLIHPNKKAIKSVDASTFSSADAIKMTDLEIEQLITNIPTNV